MAQTKRFNALLRLVIGSVLAIVPYVSYAQTATPGATEVTKTEYDVFSAYISRYFVGEQARKRVGFPVSRIVIVDTTQYDESYIVQSTSWKKVRKYLRKEVPSLTPATIENLRRVNKVQSKLLPRFDLPLPYELVSAIEIGPILPDISSWPEYYRQFPGAQGVLALSRVGFNPEGSQAIFYASNTCGGKCATGTFVIAEKRGATWVIVKEVVVSVS